MSDMQRLAAALTQEPTWLAHPVVTAEPHGFTVKQEVQYGAHRVHEHVTVERLDDGTLKFEDRGEQVEIPAHWVTAILHGVTELVAHGRWIGETP